MKRKYLLITLACLGLIAIILYHLLGVSYRNFFPYKILPTQYGTYKYIQDGAQGEHYKSELLLGVNPTTTNNITTPYYNAGDSTVVLCANYETNTIADHNGDLMNVYYKLNADGYIIDSLIFKNKNQFNFHDYIIRDSGYYTWMFDGNKQLQYFKPINKNLALSKTALIKQFRSLYNDAEYVVLQNDLQVQKDAYDGETALLLVDKKWVQLYGDGDNQFEEKGLYSTNKISNATLRPLINNAEEKATGLYVAYFHRERFYKPKASGFGGSPNGSNAVPHWDGTGYINLLYRGDTIKIKTDMQETLDFTSFSIVPEENVSTFYTHPNLKFGLYRENKYKTYVIKMIKK